ISMSTISVALSRRFAAAHPQKKPRYVAPPGFGRPDAAAAPKLFIFAPRPAPEIQSRPPLFHAVRAKTIILGGDAPAANVIKIAGNFMISTVIESMAESFSLVRKYGIDPNTFLEVLTGSLFPAPVYRTYGAMIAADKFEPAGFKLPLGFKDNRLALAAAEDLAVPMPMASLVHDQFVAALAQGLGEADWTAIARVSYRNAGL